MATAITSTAPRVDIYTRVTNRIVEQLEQGIRPWMQPWNAEHAAGRITRPLRHNGEPYKGINILQLWASAEIDKIKQLDKFRALYFTEQRKRPSPVGLLPD